MNLKDLEHRYGLSKGAITVIVLVCSIVLMCIDSLLFLFPAPKRKGGKKRLLVIKLDAIGDFILWLDFARGLRELYPASTTEITLVANVAWAKFAEGVVDFDEIIAVDRMPFLLNPVYRFKKTFLVRRRGFDIVIDPAYSREFNLSPAIVRTSGAGERVASTGDFSNQRPWQKSLSDRWYTRLLPSADGDVMELVRNAEFIRQLGHREFKARVPFCPQTGRGDGITHEPYYVIVPGAGWVNRQWPLRNFAELAALIHGATGWKGVVCGGAGEKHLGRALQEMSGDILEDRTGRTTLAELASLIAGARFVVGNETGAIHLAAAVSTPAVCILGGGHFGRFVPFSIEEETERPLPVPVYAKMDCFGCNWNCVFPIEGEEPVPCVAGVSVEAAWRAVKSPLAPLPQNLPPL